MNEVFRKFHPDAKYDLSDIIGNSKRFNEEMKKLFNKRMYKRKQM